MRVWPMLAAVISVSGTALAGGPVPVPPKVDSRALPALGGEVRPTNPYRGDAQAVQIGHAIFNQSCAVCHGPDAVGSRAPAPDLRRLDSFCRRIDDAPMQAHCHADVDVYFYKSVMQGKTLVGTVHMPPWQGVLSQEQVWALKTYLETQSP